jgi:hypothetical protein
MSKLKNNENRIEMLKFLLAEQKALQKEVEKVKTIIKPLKNIKNGN